jgi:hypothetical protein
VNEATRYRMRLLAIIGLSMFVALGARLWYLQVMISEQAAVTARSNITRVIAVPAPRGRILDVKGRTLVGNRLTTVLIMNRYELAQAELGGDELLDMLTEIAIEINRSGSLVKVVDVQRALEDPRTGSTTTSRSHTTSARTSWSSSASGRNAFPACAWPRRRSGRTSTGTWPPTCWAGWVRSTIGNSRAVALRWARSTGSATRSGSPEWS